MNAEKNGNIPDVRSCFSLLSYQRRAEKKSFICVNLELKGELSPEYMKLEVIHIQIMFKAVRTHEIIYKENKL